jgi:phosphinothricin acetyltransferase
MRPVTVDDAEAICGIYNPYIRDSAITFEEDPVSPGEMEGRIRGVTASYPWLVHEEGGEVVGYAYINQWKARAAYRFSSEISIYIKGSCRRRGIGSGLLGSLLEEVRKTSLHSIVAGVTLPNEASVGLHEKFGFKKIAQFNEIGFKLGKWLDVGYWELLL